MNSDTWLADERLSFESLLLKPTFLWLLMLETEERLFFEGYFCVKPLDFSFVCCQIFEPLPLFGSDLSVYTAETS